MREARQDLFASEPAWSPDGELIGFRSEPTGEDFVGEVHTVEPEGSDLTQITHAKGKQVLSSSFSPDSQWIIFAMNASTSYPISSRCDKTVRTSHR